MSDGDTDVSKVNPRTYDHHMGGLGIMWESGIFRVRENGYYFRPEKATMSQILPSTEKVRRCITQDEG